jgi:transcriptional regulator GlxA family with amidase domain
MLCVGADRDFPICDKMCNVSDGYSSSNRHEMATARPTVLPANARPGHAPRLRVGFVLTPRFTLTAFAGFIDALRLGADEGDRSRPIECEWAILGQPGMGIESSCGALVVPAREMEAPERFDYIVVVGGLLHGGQKVPAEIYAFLRSAARAGVKLIGLCTGSFVLARAGLLDGYVACVSWFHRDDYIREFPALRLVSNRMFIVDRDRLTCAGGTSVVHLAALLIEKHCGRAHATKSLRIMIEDQPLPANTPQPEAVITRHARDSIVRRAMLLIEQKLVQPDSIASISGVFGISTRQLQRRFAGDIGMTPCEYRLRLRLERAKWLVQTTDISLTDIGIECGFGDCSHFSRVFTSRFRTGPSRFRQTTRSNARAS